MGSRLSNQTRSQRRVNFVFVPCHLLSTDAYSLVIGKPTLFCSKLSALSPCVFYLCSISENSIIMGTGVSGLCADVNSPKSIRIRPSSARRAPKIGDIRHSLYITFIHLNAKHEKGEAFFVAMAI
ncbi:hypothetical protein KUTeg_011214 [Tegillarca granosa]|uniref:Uncharacterized protein n=1 Tax=Tegillarca granosa TaxID=220873 RepID=A0ABQ9F6P4_TEGGR|nr:hypothetical protein KUTeg_011214 [Tegillarca granosa]